jgi:stress responsive alpha/beta barrel protein
MIRHILILKQRPDATPEEIDASRAGLAGLVGVISGLLDFHWGPNVAPEERRAGFTHGFSMDFADQASLDAYGPHPQHQIAAAQVRKVFEKVIVFDFAIKR